MRAVRRVRPLMEVSLRSNQGRGILEHHWGNSVPSSVYPVVKWGLVEIASWGSSEVNCLYKEG